jgi:CheY-like chemotaxis protein
LTVRWSVPIFREPKMMRRVLVVNDNEDIREALSEILRDEGWEVVTAEHGRAALDYLSTSPVSPCLIFLDLIMPVMDGLAFRDALRALPAHRGVPIVVTTAGAAPPSIPLDVHRVLPNPLSVDTIVETVREVCRCTSSPPPAGLTGACGTIPPG